MSVYFRLLEERGRQRYALMRLGFELHLSSRTELIKDGVHDSGGEEDFPVRYRYRRAMSDGTVE